MIRLENVTIKQGNFRLRNVNLNVPTGAYSILMGATGCGKTTLLESICGLRQISSGKISLNNVDVSRLPPAAREVGYVPQDAALFPAMKVGEQIAFPLGVRSVPAAERKKRVDELAEQLGIASLLNRYPEKLSGGERQRVALARALSFKPKLICLDEPLSAIDETTHGNLSTLLREIHEREKTTILHVTHNNSEASELGNLRFLLSDGKIVTES